MVFDSALHNVIVITGLAAVGVGLLAALSLRSKDISPRPTMNKSEQWLFALLQQLVVDMLSRDHLVLSQVSYGEFLTSKNKRTFWSFNAKRADFLIIDGGTNPVAVIEYQGSGHWGRSLKSRFDTSKRDRTKRRVLSSAGVPMIEVPAKFNRESVRKLIRTSLSGDLISENKSF